MKKTLLLSTLALSLSATHAVAAPNTQAQIETMDVTTPIVEPVPSYYGVGTGAVIGTLVGGPIGLILGSAFGGMVVDDINADKHMDALQAMNAQQAQLIVLQQTELAQLSDKISNEEATYAQVSLNQPQASMPNMPTSPIIPELLTHIQFATGVSNISPIYQPQLDLLIELLSSHENWLVTLTGYADMRGDEAFNYDLSRSRAEMVKHYLTQGLQAKLGESVTPNILVKWAGEAHTVQAGMTNAALDIDLEQLMFDRRVSIDIRPVSDVQVAQQ